MRTRYLRSLVPLVTGCLVATPTPAASQMNPPATDIWIAELEEGDDGPRPGTPNNLTGRPGYDNQPRFTPDGRFLLYTSIREDGQADTWRHDFETGEARRLTRTVGESEYSPTPIPGEDRFSVVRVEADSVQRLWAFREDGTDPVLLLRDVAPVGYHAWAGPGRVALFVLGDPPTLRLVELVTGDGPAVVRGVGRSLQRIPGTGEISFVRKGSGEEWWVEALDPATGRTQRLVRTLPGSEDHAWTPGGTLLMGSGSRLYAWRPGAEDEGEAGSWREVADLSVAGLSSITRLAVSPRGERIAIVAEPAER